MLRCGAPSCLVAGGGDLADGSAGEVVDSTTSSVGSREAVRHDGALAAGGLTLGALGSEVMVGTTVVTQLVSDGLHGPKARPTKRKK